MWRQVVAQSPGKNAAAGEVLRYDVGWKALNTMLKSGRSLSGHERNCCFLNTKGGRFADISAAGNIDFDDDGRIIAVTDWDHDGDLDFWIANRTGPQARFLRNDHDNDHNFVAFRLEGVTCNRDAIGAKVELHLGGDVEAPIRYKTVRAGEGYLAQSSRWIHFGLGNVEQLEKLVVRWPDGKEEVITGIAANKRYKIRQGAGLATHWEPPQRNIALKPSKIIVPPPTDKSRIVLIAPMPIPTMQFEDAAGKKKPVISDKGRGRVINLWATWCQPCLKELDEWKSHRRELAESGLEIVAINVDEPKSDRAAQLEEIESFLKNQLVLPFEKGYANRDLVTQFDVLQRAILRRQRTLPIPSSFLIDSRGQLRSIYKGPVSAKQLIADSKLLTASSEEIVAAGVPYEGKWLGQPAGSAPNTIAIRFVEGGFAKEAEQYIRQLTKMEVDNPLYNRAEANILLGALMADQKRFDEAAAAFRSALQVDPNHRQSHIELANVLLNLKQPKEAATHLEHALERTPSDVDLRVKLGKARLQHGDAKAAAIQFNKVVKLSPSASAHHNLGNALLGMRDTARAIKQFDAALKLDERFLPSANNLAWLLSTSAEAGLRDGERAVELAERVCGNQANRSPSNLETLAVAYAEAGRFEDATSAAKEAIKIAKAAGDLKTSSNLQKHLALFRQNKPYHEK